MFIPLLRQMVAIATRRHLWIVVGDMVCNEGDSKPCGDLS